MNELKIFNNDELGISVRTMLNEDGSISINAEDTAIGFGWFQKQERNGKDYISVRWERMNSYSSECGFPHEWGKDDYVPESLYYMLGFKAGNERALKYQKWLAMEVIPKLRKTGTYTMQGKSNVEQGIAVVKFIADDLNVNPASRLLMYENYCIDVGIPTGFLPKYEHNGNRELKSATVLLKENNCQISAKNFNVLLLENGYLEERERASGKGGIKKFKALTEKGLNYGENAISPKNQREVQPLYYADTFMELFDLVQ